MATYEIKTVTVTTTSQVVVAADSDVDRVVHLVSGNFNSMVNWSFDGTNSAKFSANNGVFTLVLPEDEALHAWVDAGQNTQVIGIIVTKA